MVYMLMDNSVFHQNAAGNVAQGIRFGCVGKCPIAATSPNGSGINVVFLRTSDPSISLLLLCRSTHLKLSSPPVSLLASQNI